MPILAKKKIYTTHYYDAFSKSKRLMRHNANGMRPTSPHRRNNPHPQSDFLEPKNLKFQDAQVALQHRVQRAVQDYVLKSLGEGNYINMKRIMEHREYPQLTQSLPANTTRDPPGVSVHPNRERGVPVDNFISSSLQLLERTQQSDRKEGKRERGNHYKAAAKTYGEVPGKKPSSPTVRYPSPVRKPLVDLSMDASNKAKRTHTPPTPPADARRSKSVAYQDQLAGIDAARPSLRSRTAPVRDCWGDDEFRKDGGIEREMVTQLAKPNISSEHLGTRMKSWIEGANDFEKDVAYNMLQTLHGGPKKAPPFSKAKPASADLTNMQLLKVGGKAPAATHIYVPPSPAPRQPVPNRDGKNDAEVKGWMKNLQEKLALRQPGAEETQLYQLKTVEGRPQPPRRKRPTMISEEYRHENSHFMMTQPAYRRHFIIAPDWVSERQSHRRLANQSWARKNKMAVGVGC
ncbi:uncharacterized protein [Diadema setosum]|uniref:uncharacterized protein n=1 Tax=Diadema setosum TaxID=31175 RepID=UPI003B3AE15C